jgi:PAS domain S-box-containing protein
MRPDEARIERKLYRRQVAGELARYSIEKRIRRKDGSEIWALVMSSSVCDVNGRFRYAVRVIQDITERREAEERLRASEQRLRVLLEGLPAAIYMTDAEGRIIFFNQAAVDFSGRTPTLGTDEWCVTWKLYRPDGTPMPHEECPMAIALKEGRPIRDAEAIAERPDGTRVPFIPYPTPIFDADGKLTGAINMLVDVTEQKKAESRQKTLIDELNHRVKNTLATVQSLVRQTARGTSSIKAFEERLQGRLIALSQAHDQLTRGNWQRADLRAILTGAFSPYGEEMAEQVAVAGVPVELSPRAALALAMVFHELITNAVKYGSLSQHTGKLKVDWRVERHKSGDTLRLRWCETGGPKVKRPERRGFGTQMVERSIPAELGGRAALRFESTGVVCELEFPLAEIGDQESEQSQRSTRLRRRG